MSFEAVIGLEVHSQLLTESKMFCSCSAGYQEASPNTVVCEVCMGMPGVLPVINARAVELVVATGLALNCTINRQTKFDRKNYPYPDLMKGYQISQYDQPIATDGTLAIEVDGDENRIGITRVHLEEDVAKLHHQTGPLGTSYSFLDINRAGVPLMEIVSEPDMHTPEEARSYLTTLRSILWYIGVSEANMEEGNFRCDANISVRPRGSLELRAKVEIKNMNSFRAVHNALAYEIDRQIRLTKEGENIVQETRGWVEERGVTVSQRTKEYASDYRYFPEPDLPEVLIDPSRVNKIRDGLPELPRARKNRFTEQYGLPLYDASLLTASKPTADYFESVMEVQSLKGKARIQRAKVVSNWMLGELSRLLNVTGGEINDIAIEPKYIVELLDMIDAGTLSTSMARTVFEKMFESGGSPNLIALESGSIQISDTDAVQSAVDEAIKANPKPVSDFLDGREAAMKFLVGQVMRITRGKANPQLATRLVQEKLETMR